MVGSLVSLSAAVIPPLVVLQRRGVERSATSEVHSEPQGAARPPDQRIKYVPLALRVRRGSKVAGEEATADAIASNGASGASGGGRGGGNVHDVLSCQVFQGT